MQRTQTIGALLIITVLALGACTSTTTTPPPETVTVTPPPATITITPPAITVTVTPPPETITITPTTVQGASEEVEVLIVDHGFSPQAITVPVGTTVTWTHVDVADDHSVSSDTGLFDADLSFSNAFSYTFIELGVFKYHCMLHHDMVGTVAVE